MLIWFAAEAGELRASTGQHDRFYRRRPTPITTWSSPRTLPDGSERVAVVSLKQFSESPAVPVSSGHRPAAEFEIKENLLNKLEAHLVVALAIWGGDPRTP